jgi:hypothetical protein
MMDMPLPAGNDQLPHKEGIQRRRHNAGTILAHLQAKIDEICRIQKQHSVALMRVEKLLLKSGERVTSERPVGCGALVPQHEIPSPRSSSTDLTEMELMMECWRRGAIFESHPALSREPGQCRLMPPQPWVQAAKQCQCYPGQCERE